MIIRQEEKTPIGDEFHNLQLEPIFNELKDEVDNFSVDSENLLLKCDWMILKLRNLKSFIKKAESEYQKRLQQKRMQDKFGYNEV